MKDLLAMIAASALGLMAMAAIALVVASLIFVAI
jgi:hypothetical protein